MQFLDTLFFLPCSWHNSLCLGSSEDAGPASKEHSDTVARMKSVGDLDSRGNLNKTPPASPAGHSHVSSSFPKVSSRQGRQEGLAVCNGGRVMK